MPRLHVALQEGFQEDSVIVRLNQAEVYRRDRLKTRMQIGLADSVELEAGPGRAELEVEVPTRNAKSAIPVEMPPSGDVYVAISLAVEGDIQIQISEEPFRYA